MNTREEGFDGKNSLEKHNTIAVSTDVVDTAAELVSGKLVSFDPAEAMRVRLAFPSLPMIIVTQKFKQKAEDRPTYHSFNVWCVRGCCPMFK
jgi:hypothetical protein